MARTQSPPAIADAGQSGHDRNRSACPSQPSVGDVAPLHMSHPFFSRDDKFIAFSLSFQEFGDNSLLDNGLEMRGFAVVFQSRLIVILLVENDKVVILAERETW